MQDEEGIKKMLTLQVRSFTILSDDEFVRKLSMIFLERLDVRKAEFFLEHFPDVIRKLDFRNSWSSYFDLNKDSRI